MGWGSAHECGTARSPFLPMAFACGVGAILDRSLAPAWLVWWAVALVAWLMWLACYLQGRLRFAGLALCLTTTAVAGCWHHSYWHLYPTNEIGRRADQTARPVSLRAVVSTTPRQRNTRPQHPPLAGEWNLEAEVTALRVRSARSNRLIWQPMSGRVRVSVSGRAPLLAVGDTVQLFGRLRYACTIRCKRVVAIEEGPQPVDHLYGGPEYETLATFGSYCGIDDLNAIAYANQLCNQYGLDTISCGATIAWAFDCFGQGLITSEDTGGLALGFGDAAAMVQLTEMIGRREGFGDLLAEGSARAAAQIGRGAEALVVTTKKQEMPAHMPQVKRSLGLIYAVNPFGADHQSSEHDGAYEGGFKYYQERLAMLGLTEKQEKYSLTDEKVRFALVTEHLYSCLDSVSMCQFVFGPAWHLYGPDQLVAAVRAVTGWDVTVEELLTVGERRLNMLRAFNAREGMTREDDKLPPKMSKALQGGRTDGFHFSPEALETAKDAYYAPRRLGRGHRRAHTRQAEPVGSGLGGR